LRIFNKSIIFSNIELEGINSKYIYFVSIVTKIAVKILARCIVKFASKIYAICVIPNIEVLLFLEEKEKGCNEV
jgi:hypothetical protein